MVFLSGREDWTGPENAKKYLIDHPDIFAQVDAAVRSQCMPQAEAEQEEEAAEEKNAAAKTKKDK